MAYRNQPGRTYRRGDARTVKDQVDHMLRSLGERVVAAAAPIGGQLRQFDDMYADKVRDAIVLPEGDPRGGTPMGVVRNMTGEIVGSPITRGLGSIEGVDPNDRLTMLAHQAMKYGQPVVSVGARYALPAAGVTLAGKGLMDIAAALAPEEEDENLMIRNK